jgi:hypothetical protein
MATFSVTAWGAVVTLEHQEVDDVAALAQQGGDVTGFLATKLPGIPAIVLGAVSAYLKGATAVLTAIDQGNGVYLTMPWLALGVIIPTPRPPNIGLPADWATRPSGRFRTEDAPDLIEYQIEPNAVGSDAVEFRLESHNSNHWRKVLVIRDGEGGQWDITIDPSQGSFSASNGLWAHQVKYGQQFSLWKAKQLGINHWVLDFGGLENLQPGSRVVFTWLQDRPT